MTTTRIFSLTALGLLAFALANPALAAKRGGWDGNGTAVRGTAAETSVTAEELSAARRGGWDANGTALRGAGAEPQPLRLRGIEFPATRPAASTAR